MKLEAAINLSAKIAYDEDHISGLRCLVNNTTEPYQFQKYFECYVQEEYGEHRLTDKEVKYEKERINNAWIELCAEKAKLKTQAKIKGMSI